MRKPEKTVNAKITSTHLGPEDHGIFSFYIYLECPGAGVAFGGYGLDDWSEAKKKRVGAAFGMAAIMEVLHAVGASKWEDLPGKYVRIEDKGWGGHHEMIGHITEDRWFNIKELAEEMKNAS